MYKVCSNIELILTGVWRWEQSHQVAEYLNWSPGEPNNYNDFDEDCVWMNPSRRGWADAPCYNTQAHALCETECG